MKNNILLLICILLLGLFLRGYHLTSVPLGFFCDEASIGYNAYSILTTGKDEYGKSFPIFFRSFDDYKGGIAIYSTVPFIALFGLTEFATRIPSVLYGVLTILFLYFIGKELYSKNVGLLSAVSAAITPWLIHYDRVAFLMNVYATFFTATIYFFLKARTQPKYMIAACITAALTLYTYQPPKLIIPLLMFGIFIIFYRDYKKSISYVIDGLLVFLFLSIPLLQSFLSGEGFSRFNMVSIFSANKTFSETIRLMISHYFMQLTPQYLFFSGEPTAITRHFTDGLTPLLVVTAPFLFLGLCTVIATLQKKTSQFLLFLILIYPIGGALVLDPPFTSRSIIGAPLAAILTGLGIMQFISFLKKKNNSILYKSGIALLVISVMVNVATFASFYFTQYPKLSEGFWGWQYGAKAIVTTFAENEKNYDDLVMEPAFNGPDIFFKFYAPHDCNKCKVGYLQESYNPEKKQLFAVTPSYLSEKNIKDFKTKKTIFYPDGTVAFLIGEVVQ